MSVYNGMPYLAEAVESIFSQSYKNFEFIIVDDASTDGTWGYLKSIKDRRVILSKNDKNLGLAASLNRALKKSRGKYIARMDADDVSLAKRLETQINFMNKNPSIDICGTWVAMIDGKNRKIGKVHYPSNDKGIKQVLRRVTPLIHPTWFANANVFRELGGYLERWDYVEDYDFLIRAKKFQMANISTELLLWRSLHSRRSNKHIQKMYEKSFELRWKYFQEGKLDIAYLPFLLRSFITTYCFPSKLKIYLNRRAGLV